MSVTLQSGDFRFFDLVKTAINWRIVWYSVLIWFLGFLISAVVILPWYYLASAILVSLSTFFYFKILDPRHVKRGRKDKFYADKFLAFGLGVAVGWFLIISILTVFEIAGFYYFNFAFYFSDFRNWYLYSLIILVPVVYGLILQNFNVRRGKRKHRFIW